MPIDDEAKRRSKNWSMVYSRPLKLFKYNRFFYKDNHTNYDLLFASYMVCLAGVITPEECNLIINFRYRRLCSYPGAHVWWTFENVKKELYYTSLRMWINNGNV